jgi:uncharacterized protein
MKQSPVNFPSGKLELSGYLYVPGSKEKRPGVVICHPHPLHGGSMSNTIIRELGNCLVEQNMVALMFDFRGVGKSTGQYADGIGEQDDIVAALDYLAAQPQVDASRLGICGYSFGGMTGAPVACRDSRVKVFALIAPAIKPGTAGYLKTCKKPKFIVVGDADDMVPPQDVKAVFDIAAEPRQFQSFPGVDHFWMGHEPEVCGSIASFFKKEFEEIK